MTPSGSSLESFGRYPLLFGPSPVHPLSRLTKHLGGAAIWAKREDCNSGLAYGGNKMRKLEYLLADALARGFDTLVSIGGVQSNNTRQVAAAAARAGLRRTLIQESWVEWPDSVYDRVGNIVISRLIGADVRLVEAGFGIGLKESFDAAIKEIQAAGRKPYPIPACASDHPLGGLGFANWAFEVADQERQLGIFFDTVVVCCVTGSTQAGMIAGFAKLAEADPRPRRILGVDGSASPRKPGTSWPGSRATPPLPSAWIAPWRTRTSFLTTGITLARTGFRTGELLTRCGWPQAWRVSSQTRCTRASRWPGLSTWSPLARSSSPRLYFSPIWEGSLR